MPVLDIEVAPRSAAPNGERLTIPELPSTLRILFGSEMGNAELVADNFCDAFTAMDRSAECIALNSQPVDELNDLGIVMFVISTCGEGDMPYNAEQFWKQLSAPDAPSLTGLHYAVLALGDSGYTYFCDAGVKLDERLAELGATRMADRTDCDVSYVEPSNQWILDRVAQLVPSADSAAEAAASLSANAPTGPQWNRETPFHAQIRVNRLLSGTGSAKEIRHFEIDISDGGFEYHAGDSIGIVPLNNPDAVSRFLTATGFTGAETVDGRTLHELATDTWELRFASAALLNTVAAQEPASELALALKSGGHEAGEAWNTQHCVIETLSQLTQPLPLAELAQVMGPLRHRAYSIASTPVTHATTVHLTVATQRNSDTAHLTSGVGSGFLADALTPGDVVRVFPIPNRAFRLPENPSVPIIMVGPGVGAAPFLGFLQERAATEGSGDAWFFFGDQHEASDFIYAEELRTLQTAGALSRLDTAFSRDTDEKVYVQDRMRAHSTELVRWLTSGAYFYVCGDAQRMAADVDLALTEIAHAELGEAAGDALMAQLHEEKRYLRDVY